VLDRDGLLRRKPLAHYAFRLAQVYQGPESGLTAERIESIRAPVVLVCSERWVSPEAVRHLSPTIRVEWLGTRHHIHWDHPDEVAARIMELA
jgi:pimeloyl-ACP methyl ester carboxylesterase